MKRAYMPPAEPPPLEHDQSATPPLPPLRRPAGPDHGKLASYGDGGALHAPALGDADTPGPQARPLAGTGHQR